MIRRILRSMCVLAVVVFASLAIMGCGNSLSGKYQDATSGVSITFNSGKADVSVAGVTTEVDYTVSGSNITLNGLNGQNLVLTQQSDGSITGFPMADKLVKSGS